MPNPLNNVTVPDQYTDATSILNIFGGRGGTFSVRSQPVFYELQYGRLGDSYFTDEAALQPGSGSIEPGAIGVRFRNQVAGQVATVDARIAPPNQPLLTLNSSGTTGSTLVTGSVSAVGGIVGGTGFSVVKNGAGDYTINFNVAFQVPPAVVCTITDGGGAQAFPIDMQTPPTASSFRVLTAAGVDHAFDFVAQAMV